MRLHRFLLIAAFASLPLWVQAHAHLEKSTPAADSVGAAPEHIMLEFSEAIRMTALSVEQEGGQEPMQLEPLPAKAGKVIDMAAPKLDAGVYVLKWRAVGADNHVMSGSVRFTVKAK